MKMRVILVFVAVLMAARPAAAEPIVITGGLVSLGSLSGPFPPFGFQLLGEGTDIAGVTFDEGPSTIQMGQVVNLSNVVPVSSVPFPPFDQTVQGRFYSNVSIQGTLNFSATPFIASGSGPFSTPFTMTGELSLFEHEPFGPRGELLLTTALIGTGTASIALIRDIGDGLFLTSGTNFLFSPAPVAPIPEPGTLVLVAGGLATAVGRYRRLRRKTTAV